MEINATLIGQLITFIILVWFTMKFVWPPITKALQEREKKIADGLAAAEHSKLELEQAQHKASAIVREAKQEASHIIEQTNRRVAQLLDTAKDDARLEAKRILERANEQIELEVSQAKEALRKQLAGLAVAAAEKIIQRNLDVTTQANLLDEFVAEI